MLLRDLQGENIFSDIETASVFEGKPFSHLNHRFTARSLQGGTDFFPLTFAVIFQLEVPELNLLVTSTGEKRLLKERELIIRAEGWINCTRSGVMHIAQID